MRVRGRYDVARVVLVGIVGFAMTAPGQTIGVSVFIDRFALDLNLGRAAVSTAYLFGTLTAAAFMTTAGSWLDRFGVRRSTFVIGLAFGLAVLSFAGVSNWLTLLLAFVGVRVLGQGALTLASTTWVAKAVGYERAGPMALTLGGGQFGMALVPVILTVAQVRFGWRTAAVMGAILIWLVVPALAFYGMDERRYNLDLGSIKRTPTPDAPTEARHGWSRREATRTGMFWVLTAGWSIAGLIHTGLTFHHFSILASRGISAATAAAVFIPGQTGMLTGMLIIGVLAKRFKPQFLLPFSMASMGLAVLLLASTSSLAGVIAYGIALGLGMGSSWAQEATYLPRYFGATNIGAIRGVSAMVNIACAALGPVIVALFIAAGTLNLILMAFAGAVALVGVGASLTKEPKRAV